MTPNPILKVLSTLCSHRVRHLLMGGQACVLYGAAEFSRDTGIVLLADPGNLHTRRIVVNRIRDEDRAYWAPLRRELEQLRRQRLGG